MNWLSPHAGQILFSPDHGLVFWTPLALLVVAGLVLLFSRLRRAPDISLGRPGARRGVPDRRAGGTDLPARRAGLVDVRRRLRPAAFRRLELALHRRARGDPGAMARGWRSTAVHALVAVAVWWNLALIAQFATGLMDRQRLELAKNAYDAFVTVPAMAPRLAYRYLFDRVVVLSRTLSEPPPSHPLFRRHPLPARARERDPDDGDLLGSGGAGPHGAPGRAAGYAVAGTRSVQLLRPAAGTAADHRARAGIRARLAAAARRVGYLAFAAGAGARRRPRRPRHDARSRRSRRCCCGCPDGRRSSTSPTATRPRSPRRCPTCFRPPRRRRQASCGAWPRARRTSGGARTATSTITRGSPPNLTKRLGPRPRLAVVHDGARLDGPSGSRPAGGAR